MRDKNRIPKTLDLIGKIWGKYPDLRFFQLVDYLLYKYSEKSNSEKLNSSQAFYLEDDLFIEFLEELMKEHGIE